MTDPDTEFDLGDLKNIRDPYRAYEIARENGPVQRTGEGWLILGHIEATELLRSSTARSGFLGESYRRRLPPGAAQDEMANRINFLDPPQHTRVRKLVGKAFTPRRVEQLRPFIEKIAGDLLRPLQRYEPIDLLAAYAHEVPALVISEMLGVPTEHRDRLTQLSGNVSKLLSPINDQSELDAAVASAEEMHDFLRDLMNERRKKPTDDLISALLAAEEDNEKLSEGELLSLAATLYSAGHRTTRDLFGNGLTGLLPQPDLMSAIQDGSLPLKAVVEEFVRYETPTHVIARTVSEPFEIRDQTIAPGEPVAIILAAANRDPKAYTFPDKFEPWRWLRRVEPAPPLSFALGAHFCIGASLARLETTVMLEVLLKTYPEIEFGGDSLVWRHTGVFRGLESLPVTLGARLEEGLDQFRIKT